MNGGTPYDKDQTTREARFVVRMLKFRFVFVGFVASLGFALTGCEGPQHKMVEPPAEKKSPVAYVTTRPLRC